MKRLFVWCIVSTFVARAQEAQTSLSSQLGSMASGVSSLPSQLGQGFGLCPSSYTYSMQTWNDTGTTIAVHLESVVSVQGTKFNSKNARSAHHISSFGAPTTFKGVNICHGIVKIFEQSQDNKSDFFSKSFDVMEHDSTMNYYHAFNLHGAYEGEYLSALYGGPYTTTTEFDGIFFNNTTYEPQFTFTKNGTPYSVTLESQTFAQLSSDTGVVDSIRSSTDKRSFNFKTGALTITIPIPAEGLGDVLQDTTDTSSSTKTTLPLSYVYELYPQKNTVLGVGVQGFNMGNYNQIGLADIAADDAPTVDTVLPLRDINPVSCSIWVQSIDQYTQQTSAHATTGFTPYATPGSLWAVYITHDDIITQQLTVGSVTDLNLIKPMTKEQSAQLYVFELNTNDQTKAVPFLKKYGADNTLSSKIITTAIDPSTQPPAQLASQLQPTKNAIIFDKETGVTGALLLVDSFVPYGSGKPAARYYEIYPALLRTDSSFANIMVPYLNSSLFGSSAQEAQTAMAADFEKNIIAWIDTFNKNKDSLQKSSLMLGTIATHADVLTSLVPDLTAYLKKYGTSSLFTDTSASEDSRQFSVAGLQALYLMILGPVSLRTPPLIRQAGNNVYLTSNNTRPDYWPNGN